jgi:hypothetical protein
VADVFVNREQRAIRQGGAAMRVTTRLLACIFVLGLVAFLAPSPADCVGFDTDGDGLETPPSGITGGGAQGALISTCSMLVDYSHDQNFDVSGFTDYLVSQGWTVDQFTTGPLTEADLAPYGVLLVSTRWDDGAMIPFTPSELAAVEAFVDDGNGLWVCHEFEKDPTMANSLAGAFGVEFYEDMVYDPTDNEGNTHWPTIHELMPHPVTAGVTEYGLYAGCCLDVMSPAEVIATGDDDAYSANCPSYPPVLAVYEGAGRAVFMGESTPLHPTYYPDELDADEILLLDNIADWLCVGAEGGYLDIKPGSCPNPLNIKSQGVLPVAILGSPGFDATAVDPGTVTLEGVDPIRYNLSDVTTPVGPDAEPCECNEEGPDGIIDMTLKFSTQEIVEALGDVEDGEVIELTIQGQTYDGIPFAFVDCVWILKKGKQFGDAAAPDQPMSNPSKELPSTGNESWGVIKGRYR